MQSVCRSPPSPGTFSRLDISTTRRVSGPTERASERSIYGIHVPNAIVARHSYPPHCKIALVSYHATGRFALARNQRGMTFKKRPYTLSLARVRGPRESRTKTNKPTSLQAMSTKVFICTYIYITLVRFSVDLGVLSFHTQV